MPHLELEHALLRQGYNHICGIDEVGRGPLVGPVVAAAVILPPGYTPPAQDSKKLSAAKRTQLFTDISAMAQVGIGQASVTEIDTLNILQATLLAMTRALDNLPTPPDYALIDGNKIPATLPCAAQSVVQGDTTSLSIACASIVAKVTRDKILQSLATTYPAYGWDKNAGYGTAQHRQALLDHGITPHHRTSFEPVKSMQQKAA